MRKGLKDAKARRGEIFVRVEIGRRMAGRRMERGKAL
jgi:hypothetical protein